MCSSCAACTTGHRWTTCLHCQEHPMLILQKRAFWWLNRRQPFHNHFWCPNCFKVDVQEAFQSLFQLLKRGQLHQIPLQWPKRRQVLQSPHWWPYLRTVSSRCLLILITMLSLHLSRTTSSLYLLSLSTILFSSSLSPSLSLVLVQE